MIHGPKEKFVLQSFKILFGYTNIGFRYDFDARDGSFQISLDIQQSRIYCSQTCFPVLYRDVGDVNIHRVPWQVLVKQVDCRASMYGEFFYLKHGWHDTYQQLDLLPVFIPHNRLILLELLLSISC